MYITLCCVFVLLVCVPVEYTDASCNLSLKDDFGKPSPVYLRNGDFLAPNATGAILLQRSETLQVACPGNKRNIVLNNQSTTFEVFDIKCVKDATFRASKGSWVGNLRDITCSGSPWFVAEEIGSCYKGQKLYRMGYRIAKSFYSLYEICFDKDLVATLYVKQKLKPNGSYVQNGSRPNFIEGDLFGKTKMSKLYRMSHQLNLFKHILGEGMESQYLSNNQFLNRGHLSPRADFPLRAEQRASFHYANVAPQWRRANAGDWAALEDAARRRVSQYGALTVFTGTYGVTTLADSTGRLREIYLDTDANNNHVLPVPLYFYKILYDPAKHTAAAFITINSSFYNQTMLDKLSFCADICEGNPKYSWLRWRPNDGTHSFCCNYHDFVKKINVIPKLNVEGLFY